MGPLQPTCRSACRHHPHPPTYPPNSGCTHPTTGSPVLSGVPRALLPLHPPPGLGPPMSSWSPKELGTTMPHGGGATALATSGSCVEECSWIESLLVMGGIERNSGPEDWGQPAMMSTLIHMTCVFGFSTPPFELPRLITSWIGSTRFCGIFSPTLCLIAHIARLATEAAGMTEENMIDTTRWESFVAWGSANHYRIIPCLSIGLPPSSIPQRQRVLVGFYGPLCTICGHLQPGFCPGEGS